MSLQPKHKIIIGVTAFLLIVGVGFMYSKGSSFQGALWDPSSAFRQDRDRDGMPDIWEDKYELDNTLNDSADDPDSDGLSNIDEYTYKTYPNDADSDDGTVEDGTEVDNATDPLDPADDASYLPDLVADEASTTFSVSGNVVVDTGGNVWGYDIIMTITCGVRNAGIKTASGPSSQRCEASPADADGSYSSPTSESSDIDLSPGEVLTFNRTLAIDKHTFGVDPTSLLQTLHDVGSIGRTISYEIDYNTDEDILELDETNNTSSYSLNVDDSLITWTVENQHDFAVD